MEKKRILFVCVGNTCRSQMAEGFARRYGEDLVEVRSAGTAACGFVSRDTVDIMREKGIDISGQTSDQLTAEMLRWADVVVTMGCMPAASFCPPELDVETYDWPIADPLGRTRDFFRGVRDDIEQRVRALIEEKDTRR